MFVHGCVLIGFFRLSGKARSNHRIRLCTERGQKARRAARPKRSKPSVTDKAGHSLGKSGPHMDKAGLTR
ncbi:hypothetical protein DVDV_3396 [Desulfovibrio sp. DV]|nr:hypothetical protein DVDV_3396 [Desulfovibrio sp. DV]